MIFAIYASYVIGVDKIVNSGLENLSSFDQALFWVFSLSVLILFILEAFIPEKMFQISLEIILMNMLRNLLNL